MSPLLILEGVGPNAESLAMEAGRVTETPVGWDGETATFDTDAYPNEGELQGVIFDALNGLDPAWREHLKPVD
jgi:hypothetical protein